MRIAVIGAGLAGIGVAYFLIKKGHEVTLFDQGGGGSIMPAGICHPYPGRTGKPCKFAYEGLELAKELLDFAEQSSGKVLADRSGLVRKEWKPAKWYDDLEEFEDGILIKSGMKVFMEDYVLAMRKALPVVENDMFDRKVFACGAGMQGFSLPINFVKGHVLLGTTKIKVGRTVSKSVGHLSSLGEGKVQIGSTYEHEFDSDKPDLEVAKKEMSEKIDAFFPNREEFQITECRAGIRVSVKGSYTPITKQISEKEFVFTGLGSRGLLYHAYYGRHLANLIT